MWTRGRSHEDTRRLHDFTNSPTYGWIASLHTEPARAPRAEFEPAEDQELRLFKCKIRRRAPICRRAERITQRVVSNNGFGESIQARLFVCLQSPRHDQGYWRGGNFEARKDFETERNDASRQMRRELFVHDDFNLHLWIIVAVVYISWRVLYQRHLAQRYD